MKVPLRTGEVFVRFDQIPHLAPIFSLPQGKDCVVPLFNPHEPVKHELVSPLLGRTLLRSHRRQYAAAQSREPGTNTTHSTYGWCGQTPLGPILCSVQAAHRLGRNSAPPVRTVR